MSKPSWLKIATRNLPFYRMVMIYQSFARYKKTVGWPYGDSLTTFDRGIISLYRRKSDLEKYLAHFGKLKDKGDFFDRLEARIKKTAVDKKDFASLHKLFLEFWPLANLPLALENAMRLLGKEATLARYRMRLVKLRQLSQTKILELEKRLDRAIKTKAWQYATPEEIVRGKVQGQKLKSRGQAVLILEEGKVRIVTGGGAKSWFKLFTEAIETPTVIRGKSAYRGHARGRARIIFYKKDLKKFGRGEILVAPMTEVDYVPYMKKAAAIITDEGGLTSHAAIICRELKIPCVIGTRIATKVLKNSQMVEVDANKGMVKILK